MLGPIVVALSLLAPRLQGGARSKATVGFFRLVPWFILGFLVFAALRSLASFPRSWSARTEITSFSLWCPWPHSGSVSMFGFSRTLEVE